MKLINHWLSILLFWFSGTDANRARRLRRHAVNPNSQLNEFNSKPEARQLPQRPNSQILNAQGQQHVGQSEIGLPKDGSLGQNQAGRQYYPYQGQMGAGYNQPGIGNINPYGTGQYGQYGQGGGQFGQGVGQFGQGIGQYGTGLGQYGSSYNQYPSSGGYYSGYNSGSNYNRPSYSSNYQSGMGGSSYYGNRWNAGQKQQVNTFSIFLSSLLALAICSIAV
ncbi:unnamed protein product [Rotaria socialis]|uniref:Uncharacterized protein n=1 Tax=Rotaria socialis TaxID=392032 RepID=A0A820WCX1_9BILA|nr:unnamed protein product [Rotaria socialis]CAF4146006.1 unnamed protein product [Rotaria socialis]CAF4239862.1 unnamed protein product [Rotaria socialis]CAF4446017.1 unnamed protein product [Rotaria socialis]CAF4515992.1 unnamed protein product [Rotaria socialis]